MRKEYKFWLTSLGISIAVHLLLLTTAAFAFSGLLRPEIKDLRYVEVEITEAEPLKKIEAQPGLIQQSPEPEPVQPQTKEPPRPSKNQSNPDNKPLPIVPNPQIAASSDAAPAPVGSISPNSDNTDGGFPGTPSSGSGNNPAGSEYGSSNSKGKSDKRATPSYAPLPDYPTEARTQKLEGTVRVRVEIDETGRVLSVSISAVSGSTSLDQAALSCARKWRFSPAYLKGRAVADSAVIPITFDLRRT